MAMATAQICVYCKERPSTPKWLFGSTRGNCFNPACFVCAAARELSKAIDKEGKTVREVVSMLTATLKEEGLNEEGMGVCDWHDSRYVIDKPFPEQASNGYRWIACYPVTGANEGHYIHIDLIIPALGTGCRTVVPIAMSKTFSGIEMACKIASRSAELLGA